MSDSISLNSPADETSKRILVLGGHGFIGRHAVASLTRAGHQVIIGTRAARSPGHRHRQLRFEGLLRPELWREFIEDVDVVLNCVGILRPWRAATYERVHHLAPAALAGACKAAKKRFVHVSALGLDVPARSGFLTSKQHGERAIQSQGGNWIIARPSLLDGDGGYGAAWLRGVARLPLFVVPADAKGRIAGLAVTDLGDALAQLCLRSPEHLALDDSRVFELGGEEAVTFKEYILGLRRRYTHRQSLCISIPGIVARLGAHICDLFYATPFSFGHWELLRRDNTPAHNRLEMLLGRKPERLFPGSAN